MDKKEIRKLYLGKRNSLIYSDIKQKSDLIHEKLFSCESYSKASEIFTYVSFGSEVLTMPIIERALKDGKKVAVPLTIPLERKMVFIQIWDMHSFRKSKFGVLEPVYDANNVLIGGTKTLNLIPGIVFDKKMNRIGYGAGYYDKYLSENKFLKNIGLCFSEQIIESFKKEIYDIGMDLIITEEDIYA